MSGSGMRVRQSPFQPGAGGPAAGPMSTSNLPGVRPPPVAGGWYEGPSTVPPPQPLQPQMAPETPMPPQPQAPVAPPQPQQPAAPLPQQGAPDPNAPGAAMMQGLVGGVAAAAGGQGAFQNAMYSAVGNELYEKWDKSPWRSYFPVFFAGLQQQFNVGHSYVGRKLLLLLCPFIQRSQGTPTPWGGDSPGGYVSGKRLGPDGLKVDIEEADLYIPLMSYFTYGLAFGVQRGILSDFRPEVLVGTLSFASVMFLLEIGFAKLGFYIAGTMMPMLELAGNCGYKFVHVVLMVVTRIVVGPSNLYYIFFAYFAACSAFATRRFMLRIEPLRVQQPQQPQHYSTPVPSGLHNHIILGLALAQLPLCWLLTPYAEK